MERRLKMLAEDEARWKVSCFKRSWRSRQVVANRSFVPLPTEVQATTERFWRSIDSFEAFVADKLVLQPGVSTTGPAIFETYKEFCQDNNYRHTLGPTRFYEKLSGLPGVWRNNADESRPFVGVRLAELAPLALMEES
jgi:hypothetical protein